MQSFSLSLQCASQIMCFPDSYHMQYSHGSLKFAQEDILKLTRFLGISAFSAAPFSPPMIFRTKPRNQVTKHERSQITEGKCHKCSKWIPLETIKDADVKVCFASLAMTGDSPLFCAGQRDLLVSAPLRSFINIPTHLHQIQVEACRYLSSRIHNRRRT